MAKKNSPDAAGKGSNADGAQPKKRSKFISEFDMWDINLDISSDDTIDPTVRSGEKPKNSTSTQPIRTVDSRAKTTPLPTGSTKPVVTKPAAKPAITNRVAAKPSKPQVQTSNTRRNTVDSRGAAPSQHTARQSVDPRIAKPRNPESSASQQPLPRMRADTQSRRDAAVFTTRDVNRYIIPQNVNQVEELQKKRRYQKIVKSVSWLWSVVKFVWGVLDSIVSFFFKVSPRLYRNKALVVTALVSFFLGFFLGGFTSGTKDRAMTTPEMLSSTQTHAREHVSKRKATHNRSARKRAERHVAAKRTIEPQPSVAQDNVLPDSNREPSNADTQTSNQFSGKEIPINGNAPDAGNASSAVADVAENSVQAGTTAGSNVTATQSQLQQQSQSEAKSPQKEGGSQDSNASATADDVEFNRLQNLNLNYFNQKQWQKVVDTSAKMLNLKPFTESALINRSVAYTELDQYSLAVNDANTLIAMNKHNGVAFNNRAYAYEKAGNLIKALADYTKACDLGVQQSCNDMNRMKHNLSRKR